eukprot:3508583-Rhodomonas_salina.1
MGDGNAGQLFEEDLRATIEENLRLKSHTAEYENEIKRLKDILAQHADTNEQAQKAVDKVPCAPHPAAFLALGSCGVCGKVVVRERDMGIC